MAFSSLFEPVDLGSLKLRNRFVMAPMTRSRASRDGILPESAPTYYAQRATAGLIVSEGVCVSPVAVGNPKVPGIWTNDQMASWAKVASAVHGAGGTIVAQLWHTGRASHPSLQPGGQAQVGPSAIGIDGSTYARDGRAPHVTPRALETLEIPVIVAQYQRAAHNAIAAGLDGVEIHAANGYLIDQFLQDNANTRTDAYGGTIENRARFLAEVIAEVSAEIGADRVGVRISPASTFQGMADSDPAALFGHVLAVLDEAAVAYLHIVEPGIDGSESLAGAHDVARNGLGSAWARERYTGKIVAAGGYQAASAEAAVLSGHVDAVAFGRPYIANPDLPERVAGGTPLTESDRATYYGGGDAGYIDYPASQGTVSG
ncbi:alkene reductase [Saccharopolyspora karakumensis]|uniref:Alkene reductase n=1 Tax=Saccharopolyspora karakumensis TaxID=2530386 RepID=A0A4R5BWI4_9PSEU|nr:alkene reductase [Saccharopolyspora karakumensis]TDD90575.1 alkene reductase [Saccharopolyspora karakumensis]